MEFDPSEHSHSKHPNRESVGGTTPVEQRLRDSETRYRFLADNMTDLIMLVGANGKRTYVSAASKALLGYEPEEMLAIKTKDAIHPDDVPGILRILAMGSHGGTGADETVSYRMRRKDGSYVWVETTGRAVDLAGHDNQRLVIVRNIEERVAAERRIKESEARYRLLAENSSDMVFELDRELVVRYVSPACREILGCDPGSMIGVKPLEMVHPEDRPRLSLVFNTLFRRHIERHSIVHRALHASGRWVWVESALRVLKCRESGNPIGVTGSIRDISVRKAMEDELAEANRRLEALARIDGLTGLPNRRAFDEAIANELNRARSAGTSLSLIMVDVDRFKAFNDRFGHLGGDDCLRRVAKALSGVAQHQGCMAARYGGEEFVILLPDTNERDAREIAERIRLAVMVLQIDHLGSDYGVVTISAGVASISTPCRSSAAEDLIGAADAALYRAKDTGRNRIQAAQMTKPKISIAY